MWNDLIETVKSFFKDTSREDGFNYAASELLRGTSTVQQLEQRAFDPWNSSHPFDRGIHDAIRAWQDLHIKVSDIAVKHSIDYIRRAASVEQ